MEEVNLKELLIQYYKDNDYDWEPTNEALYETFVECSNTVYTSEPDHHRWYTLYNVVREFTVGGEDYFFADQQMSVDGDNSRRDCGWEDPYIEDIVQVFPKQVLTTVYVTKDKL
jgi:hypothetical protein